MISAISEDRGTAPESFATPGSFDGRFVYVESESKRLHVSCGIVRDIASSSLYRQDENIYNYKSWADAIQNPLNMSTLVFALERAVLNSLYSNDIKDIVNGLSLSEKHRAKYQYTGKYPGLKHCNSGTDKWIHVYFPTTYNQAGIDCIVIIFEAPNTKSKEAEQQVTVVGVKVTTSPRSSHPYSEVVFFNMYDELVKQLAKPNRVIVPGFLWILADKTGEATKEEMAEKKTPRQGKVIWPTFHRYIYTVAEIDPYIGGCLLQGLNSLGSTLK